MEDSVMVMTRAEYIRTNGWNCGYVLTLANGSAIIRTLERDWERPQLVTRVLTTFNGNILRDYRYAYDILDRITNRIKLDAVLYLAGNI